MNRRPTPETGAPRSRSAAWRWPAVVYAVVVILCLAGTGAHALWSQSGTAAASVSTGAWAPQPVSGAVVCSAETGLLASSTTLTVDFDFPLDADAVTVAVKDGTGTTRTQTIRRGSGTSGKATLTVESRWLTWDNGTFPLTLTSSSQGVDSKPLSRSVAWNYKLVHGYIASC